jgi:4-amino-4-deoxy-L-arabinose transferase-like glycosyltransferase
LIQQVFERRVNIWISTLEPADPIPVDEEMDYPIPADLRNGPHARRHLSLYLVILLIAAAIYVGCMVSPPWLMDDVDSVQAQISRTMLDSGDWVTARIDGVAYLEKSPLNYWLVASFFRVLGTHDWAARIPGVFSAVVLSLITCAFGIWAFGKRAGLYAGLCISTCVGLFLFTRILIPDVMLVLTITMAMWAFLRVLDPEEAHPRAWAAAMAASIGIGFLLKSLVALVFPAAAAVIYLCVTRQMFSWDVWKRLRPFSGLVIGLAIATPWVVLATLRNPPTFAWTLHSGPGEYHGFLWFYFINEQLLRFLNMRYPRDYATVPRFYFWALHLVWLFPWSVYFPAIAKLSFRPTDRAGRTRLLALCWTGFLLAFFTFSTTQEYYSMPCYPALALLAGSAMAEGGDWVRWGTRALAVISGIAALACAVLLWMVRNVPTPGDISAALVAHPTSKLSMGHIDDLTITSFAYLRWPLVVAAIAFLIGGLGNWRATGHRAFLSAALMMVVFFQAARLALVDFDPFLSSRPLAEALLHSPDGQLIVNGQYYVFSSLVFYANRNVLLLNGRINNLVYGSYAPKAPDVFIDDGQFKSLWFAQERRYVVSTNAKVPQLEDLVGAPKLILVADSGGKSLYTNLPLTSSAAALNLPAGKQKY